jgi:2-aminoethylphosphonate-pyruvate transaminase
MSSDRLVLLTPGPCMTSDAVRAAAGAQDLNHRDPEYLALIREVNERLLAVYEQTRSGFIPYLISGSGTAAVEAMLSSCMREGPVLIIENGYYSARLKDILEVHGIPLERLSFGWLEPWDLDRVRDALRARRYEAVVCTHNETTTGRLNPVEQVAALAKEAGAKMLVDVMSSFGADDLNFESLDAVCASANKCLHGLPGVGFVLVREQLAEEMRSYPRHTYYLSLPMYEGENPRLTPPVTALAALRQALREMAPGMQKARRETYLSRAAMIRDALTGQDLQVAVPAEDSSCTVTTAEVPPGWSAAAWLQRNRESGYLLYGCKGELEQRYFQVANMGELTEGMIQGWVELLPRLVR